MAQCDAENIGLFGRVIQQRKRGMLKLSQRLRRIEITEDAPAIVFKDFRRRRDITLRRPLDGLNGAADCGDQVWKFEFFSGNESITPSSRPAWHSS